MPNGTEKELEEFYKRWDIIPPTKTPLKAPVAIAPTETPVEKELDEFYKKWGMDKPQPAPTKAAVAEAPIAVREAPITRFPTRGAGGEIFTPETIERWRGETGPEVPVLSVTPPPMENVEDAIRHMERASRTHQTESDWDKQWRSTYADVVNELNEIAGGSVNDRRLSGLIQTLVWDIRADKEQERLWLEKGDTNKANTYKFAYLGYQQIVDLVLPLVRPETRATLEGIINKEFPDIYPEDLGTPAEEPPISPREEMLAVFEVRSEEELREDDWQELIKQYQGIVGGTSEEALSTLVGPFRRLGEELGQMATGPFRPPPTEPTWRPPTAEEKAKGDFAYKPTGAALEQYEEWKEKLPWFKKIPLEFGLEFLPDLLYYSAVFGALPPAIMGWRALATAPTPIKIAGRTALAPFIAAEAAPRAVIKYGIVLPITKGIPAGAKKAFELALDTGIDKWLAAQGRKGEAANIFFRKFLTPENKARLTEFATNHLIKRQAEAKAKKKGVEWVAQQAADDTIKSIEPLLLKEVKPPVKPPVKPEVAPTPAVEPVVTPPVAKPPVTPAVKPPVAEVPPVKLLPKPPIQVQRKQEITRLLATPKTELPTGVSKIALRKELSGINAKLVPAEKKLRQQIMAEVKTIGLPQSQYREVFRKIGGSRWLTQVNIERLPRVLESVRTARPVSIRGKKVIKSQTEELIQASKQELIDQDILTEETYQDILKALKLKTDKYVSKESFITESDGRGIIKEMRNRAILAPLGELKFGKPTVVQYLTSDVYYGQVLGLHPLLNPLQLAKVDFDLAYRAMAGAIGKQINKVNKAFGVSAAERLAAKAEGRPTKGVAKLRDLLDKFEEAPAELTSQQKAEFNWFRNLNRTIINGENEVRRGLGMPEIAYREAYVRHIPDSMADEILRGLHPLPPSLEYWSKRIVSKKIFNPMEMHRQLSDDLAKLYTKDLVQASRNMVYTGLKEIHLAQPLKAFTERMGALQDVMPASTRKWVVDFVNQRIKGQQTEWDANLNRLVTESGFGGLMDKVLRPYRLSLGTQPVTQLAQAIGRGTILAVLGLPRPRLLRLMIRNTFQRTQELAFHNPIAVLKGFAFEKGKLKELLDKSRFWKAYTGVEEMPTELMGKLEKVALTPYQITALINARQAMRTTYYDTLPFFTKARYKDLGWASPKRTYKEAKDFLYPEEETLMLTEMELAARATQYQYIGMGMPGIFRNKTLIPVTRLQSWWMNHFFMFHREAAHRFLYGQTRLGQKLPWSRRINYLTYLLLGGAILTSMGYGMSYLWRVLPHNLSPVGQFMTGLLTYVGAASDWERDKGKREIFGAWKAMVPGPLAWDEFQKFWSGEWPLWMLFFYGREEEEMPPRPPTWNIINRQPAIDLKVAKRDIAEAVGQLGQTNVLELPEPYHYIDEVTGEVKLYTPTEETYVYTTVDLGAAIKRATLKFESKDITEEQGFSPLTLFYKEAEGMWEHYYYSLPSSQRIALRESADGAYIEAYLVFWGKLSVFRNDNSEAIVREWMGEYEVPLEAISVFEAVEERRVKKEAEKARKAEAQRKTQLAEAEAKAWLAKQRAKRE